MPYAVSLGGARFQARMTLVRLGDGTLLVHWPGPFGDDVANAIPSLGRVGLLVAPGNFHTCMSQRGNARFRRPRRGSDCARGLIERDAKAVLRRAWRFVLG
jgi:hypothetical protein